MIDESDQIARPLPRAGQAALGRLDIAAGGASEVPTSLIWLPPAQDHLGRLTAGMRPAVVRHRRPMACQRSSG